MFSCFKIVPTGAVLESSLTEWIADPTITGIKEEAAKCMRSRATILSLSKFYLNKLPSAMGMLTHLTELDLSHNHLTSLPSGIGRLTNLTKLNLCYNNLTSLPLEIRRLKCLTHLDLLGNKRISSIKQIGELTTLTLLVLNEINISSLPTEIGRLTRLTQLYLSATELKTLPKEIGKLTSLTRLVINTTNLSSLPTEIGRLTRLTYLFLRGNKLETLPKEIAHLTNLITLELTVTQMPFPLGIGRLTKLTRLDLSHSNFTSLPTEIGRLTNLSDLSLDYSGLLTLPTEIGLLTNLTRLWLDNNELTSLPTEIGRLISLTSLKMHKNKLTSLPQETGNLVNLTQFTLYSNRHLRELPMSLGQIHGLTDIDIDETEIDYAVRDSITTQCFLGRDGEAVEILPARLLKWKAIAQISEDLDVSALTDERKKILNEWLLRLEKTRDFANFQSSLAFTVCRIVADVMRNAEFQELFVNQAEANNTCCQDRAAMALNEIYTSWMILCKSVDLKIMTGVAKTLCLRKELQKLIPKGERESVEIFLYYESMLRDRLHLVTAIQTMAYGDIGKRKWIDVETLVKNVNDRFFADLLALPGFERLAKSALKEEWDRIERKAGMDLTERPEGDELSDAVLTWCHNQGQVMQEKESAWAKCVRKWYEAVYVV